MERRMNTPAYDVVQQPGEQFFSEIGSVASSKDNIPGMLPMHFVRASTRRKNDV